MIAACRNTSHGYIINLKHWACHLQATASLASGSTSSTMAASGDFHASPSKHRARQASGHSKRAAAHDSEDREMGKKPRFRSDQGPLPVCAVCLSRKPHPTIVCEASSIWDGRFETFAKRVNKLIYAKSSGKQICARWQREHCPLRHTALHICSGCGADSHGVQRCPRAQSPSDADAIQG